jgi:hypothetical protein
MKTNFAAACFFAIAALPLVPAQTQAQSRPQSGTLTCTLGPSVGLIIGSRQHMACVFRNAATGQTEAYRGRIGRLGLDVGITAGGRMVWGVYAKTTSIAPRALVGDYIGASGDISLGLGVGANALVGGSHRTVALQPLSLEGQVGVNLALGVARLALR